MHVLAIILFVFCFVFGSIHHYIKNKSVTPEISSKPLDM